MVTHCEHQSEADVDARWATVDAMEHEDVPATLMVCRCCPGPSVSELCSRCEGKLL